MINFNRKTTNKKNPMKKILLLLAVGSLAVTGCHSDMDSSKDSINMNQSTNAYNANVGGKDGKIPPEMQTNAP